MATHQGRYFKHPSVVTVLYYFTFLYESNVDFYALLLAANIMVNMIKVVV